MNRFFSAKFLVAATLATAALGAATVAEARPDVYFSVGFQNDPAWMEPAPVYVQPRRVYVQPQPVYVQPAPEYMRPPVFVSPREVFEGPRFSRYEARREWERERARRRDEWRRHEWREEFRGGNRDYDRYHDDNRGDRKHHH
jgi:hypothetical protein